MTSSAGGFTVHLRRSGKRLDIQVTQVTSENLRKLFKVDPSEVYLSDTLDGTAYLPDASGDFNLQQSSEVTSGTCFTVEGPDLSVTSPAVGSSSITLTSTPSNSPSFRSVVSKSKPTTFTIKILKATIKWKGKGKPDFHSDGQLFVELKEETANVGYILENVQKKWGDDFLLVTNDGVQLDESPGTTGLAFWKCPRRKIYAVEERHYHSLGKRKSRCSDTEDFEPDTASMKRTRLSSKINSLLEDMNSVKASIDTIFAITKDIKIPLGLQKVIKETLKCTICMRVPIRPPLITTKCCKNILGCESCVNTWFSGSGALTKPCPLCNTPRGYSETLQLNGIPYLLEELAKIESLDSGGQEDEENDTL